MKAIHHCRKLALTLVVGLSAVVGASALSQPAQASACEFINGTPNKFCVLGRDIKKKVVSRWKLADGIVPLVTILRYNGTTTDDTPSSTPEFLRDVGSFTKQKENTSIKLTWVGHAEVDGLSCFYQLRIDGNHEPANSSLTGGAIINNDTSIDEVDVQQFSAMALFPEMTVGVHDIEIWVRGVGANLCRLNPGNWTHTIVVEESFIAILPPAAPAAGQSSDAQIDGTSVVESVEQ